MYHWTGDMLEERQHAYKSMREVHGRRVRQKAQDVQAGSHFSFVFDPRIIPGTSLKIRSFWAGPYQVTKLMALAVAEIKPVCYPGEERLVSLDVFKLYRGEDLIHQSPEDICM